MKKKYVLSILVVLLAVVVFSAFSNNNDSNIAYATYSTPYMSFQYPAGWGTENNAVVGVNIYNGSVNSTANGWFDVEPCGTDLGKNGTTISDFNSELSDDIAQADPSMVTKGNFDGAQYTLIKSVNYPQGGGAYYFTKNDKTFIVRENVNDSILKHVISTLN